VDFLERSLSALRLLNSVAKTIRPLRYPKLSNNRNCQTRGLHKNIDSRSNIETSPLILSYHDLPHQIHLKSNAMAKDKPHLGFPLEEQRQKVVGCPDLVLLFDLLVALDPFCYPPFSFLHLWRGRSEGTRCCHGEGEGAHVMEREKKKGTAAGRGEGGELL
jgi:hypothetical protein